MTSDATQCQRMAADAADAAERFGGISIEIRLFAGDGYHLWRYEGTLPQAMADLAAVEPVGGTQ